jgi:hypothetical protein
VKPKAWHGLLLCFGLCTQVDAASNDSSNDLRDIRVGMPVVDIPAAGYVDFSCTGESSRKLEGWPNWRDCPESDGFRSIDFGFDPATSRDGTVVAGHPVILTLLVDREGSVAGLEINTQPKGPLFVRKKAFLLGVQVKSRYGADGWTCSQAQPQPGELPVGGVFLNERCAKTLKGRTITVERRLFRRANEEQRNFVNETRIKILRAES